MEFYTMEWIPFCWKNVLLLIWIKEVLFYGIIFILGKEGEWRRMILLING